MRISQGSEGKSGQHRRIALAAGAVALLAGTGVAVAAAVGEPISEPAPVVVNESFASPLTERFGDVRVGKGVFIAGNTTLRADPNRRVTLGDHTNVQDNVSVLALTKSASTGAQTSLAHQARYAASTGTKKPY